LGDLLGLNRGSEDFPPNLQRPALAMSRTEGFNGSIESLGELVAEIGRIQRFATNHTSHQFHGCHFLPRTGEDMLELHRLLRADPPAVTTSGAAGHIVEKPSPVSLIFIIESARRTVLHAGKTSIAFLIHSKKGHG